MKIKKMWNNFKDSNTLWFLKKNIFRMAMNKQRILEWANIWESV